MQWHHDERLVPHQYRRLLGRKTGLVNSLYRIVPNRGDPNVHLTVPNITDLSVLLDEDREFDLSVGGKSDSIGTSFRRAIGETVERYAMHTAPQSDAFVHGSYADLSETHSLVPFGYLTAFGQDEPDHEYLGHFTRTDDAYWIPATDLLDGERVLVPAEMVWGTAGSTGEPRKFVSTSNGAAAGPTMADALVNALYEAIERDAFMRTWCTQTQPRRIGLAEFPELRALEAELVPNRNLTVVLFELPSPLDVHVVGSALVNERDEFPKFMMGASASLSFRTALRDAIAECAQGWPYLHTEAVMCDVDGLSIDDDITSLDENALLYAAPENFHLVEFLVSGDRFDPSSTADTEHEPGDPAETLERLLSSLADAPFTPLALDITPDDIRDVGVDVAKVYVPELVPFSLPSYLPACHPALDDETVTDLPHPFP